MSNYQVIPNLLGEYPWQVMIGSEIIAQFLHLADAMAFADSMNDGL